MSKLNFESLYFGTKPANLGTEVLTLDMVGLGKELEIVRPIIEPVSIPVMNDLARFQPTIQLCCHEDSVQMFSTMMVHRVIVREVDTQIPLCRLVYCQLVEHAENETRLSGKSAPVIEAYALRWHPPICFGSEIAKLAKQRSSCFLVSRRRVALFTTSRTLDDDAFAVGMRRGITPRAQTDSQMGAIDKLHPTLLTLVSLFHCPPPLGNIPKEIIP